MQYQLLFCAVVSNPFNQICRNTDSEQENEKKMQNKNNKLNNTENNK